MGRYAQLSSEIWFNKEFINLDSDKKVCYLYMLSCPHSNMNGFYRLPMRYIQADLGLTELEAQQLIKGLVEKKFIYYGNEVVLIRTYLKYNTPKSPTQLMGVGKALKTMPKRRLTTEFIYLVGLYCEKAYKWIDQDSLIYLREYPINDKGLDVLNIYNNYLLLGTI